MSKNTKTAKKTPVVKSAAKKVSYAGLNTLADCARSINMDPKAARSKYRRAGNDVPVKGYNGYDNVKAKKVVQFLQADRRSA